jgi:heme-degrading monooxygenase HmoA
VEVESWMIVRTWRATATAAGAAEYGVHFERVVLPKLRALDGFRGAVVLTEEAGEVVRVEDLTFWESLDAVRAFAGEELEVAVVDEVAQGMLLDFDRGVTHRDVVVAALPQSN